MGLSQLDTRRAELVVGALLIAIGAVVARECLRLGAGWGTSGPQAGFFPLIAASVVIIGAVVVIVGALREPGRPIYESPVQVRSMLQVGAPIALAVASLEYVGFYVMTAVYVGLFSAWFGRYRWYVAAAAGLLLAAALFFTFERGFRISLPKSLLYASGFPF